MLLFPNGKKNLQLNKIKHKTKQNTYALIYVTAVNTLTRRATKNIGSFLRNGTEIFTTVGIETGGFPTAMI